MKAIILSFAMMTVSASAFAYTPSRGSCDRHPDQAGCEAYDYKGPWIDAGVKKKCWKNGKGENAPVTCGYVHEYRNYTPGSGNGPKDLNGDGKISAYERMVWQQEENENGGH